MYVFLATWLYWCAIVLIVMGILKFVVFISAEPDRLYGMMEVTGVLWLILVMNRMYVISLMGGLLVINVMGLMNVADVISELSITLNSRLSQACWGWFLRFKVFEMVKAVAHIKGFLGSNCYSKMWITYT